MRQSALAYEKTPLREYIDEQRRDELARKYFLAISKICDARDPVTACREKFAAIVLKLASYQVLVIPPEPENDPSGLRGQPGISGELAAHLDELFEKNDGLRSAKFHAPGSKSGQDNYRLVQKWYWETYWWLETLNTTRSELGDSIADKDWFRPFLHAACAHHEHVYRWELDLSPAFEASIAGEASTAYSMFADIVLSGAKDPAVEWRNYYRQSGIPMPEFEHS